jgi:3-oxoacyl-[acyl-carrier-protein] synthase II
MKVSDLTAMETVKATITGMGAVSAAGANVSETLDSFNNERRNGGPVTLFKTDINKPVFEAAVLDHKYSRGQMRTLDLAICAVNEALQDAKLGPEIAEYRVGVCLGTTVASQLNDLEFYQEYRNSGAAPMDAVDVYLNGNIAEAIARKLDLNGPCSTIVNACSSGADAIGVALSWLKNGVCDIAIAGGADELNRVPLCGFGSLGLLSDTLCKPFDRDRQGLNLGEGAGILVLETQQVACRRSAGPNMFLAGYGSAADAYHLTAPRPDGSGLKSALSKAMEEAKIGVGDVSFINAHGTATRENDRVEGAVLAEVFGPEIKALSTKGYTGHTLGAAGGLEAVFTAAALREKWIPASAGFDLPDEEIPLTPVTEKTEISGRYALSTSLAFGGNNTVLVIEKTETGQA